MVLSYLMIALWLRNGLNKLKFLKRRLKPNLILPNQLKENLKRKLLKLLHKKCKNKNSKLKRRKKRDILPSNTTAIHSITSLLKNLKLSSRSNQQCSTKTNSSSKPIKRKINLSPVFIVGKKN